MRGTSLPVGALLGLLTGLPLVAISYLASAAGLPFVPYDLFEWLARVLPGRWIAWSIDRMVGVITALHVGPIATVAKAAEKSLAVIVFLAAAVLLGLALAAVSGVARRRLPAIGVAAGGVFLALTLVAEASLHFDGRAPAPRIAWLIVLLFGWGASLGWLVQRSARTATGVALPGRRRFLQAIAGGAVAVATVAFALGRLLGSRGGAGEAGAGEIDAPTGTSGPAASPAASALAARPAPAPGTRREITRLQDFYRIEINLSSPRVSATSWRLVVDGLVRRPLSLGLDEVRAQPSVTQMATLECISNPIGGDLISTGRFTGIRLADILARAGLLPGARSLFVEAADGYYETVTLADAADARTLLVHEMNGLPLLPEHGFPLRISIPNRYGMKQPKRIRRIQAVTEERPGYWVERGWDREAIARTTSVIDAIASSTTAGGRSLSVGGIAYAGARGVSRVEVQADDGPWLPATLIAPPVGPLTWVLWHHEWPYARGRHVFRVRAYDGTGVLQAQGSSPPEPAGATGIHERVIDV